MIVLLYVGLNFLLLYVFLGLLFVKLAGVVEKEASRVNRYVYACVEDLLERRKR